jgi:hypothetical protein
VEVELMGFEPTTSCMPSQSHRRTGPYGASLDTTSHQVDSEVKGLAVLSCVGAQGPVADTLLTTDRMQNPALYLRASGASGGRRNTLVTV